MKRIIAPIALLLLSGCAITEPNTMTIDCWEDADGRPNMLVKSENYLGADATQQSDVTMEVTGEDTWKLTIQAKERQSSEGHRDIAGRVSGVFRAAISLLPGV